MTLRAADEVSVVQRARVSGLALLTRVCAVLLTCLLTMSVTATPADSAAAGAEEVTLQATSLKVWRSQCGNATYRLTVDETWADWKARIRVYKPSGRLADTETMRKGESTGRKMLLCPGYDRLGKYEVTAFVTQYNEDDEVVGTTNSRTTFTFSIRPKDKTRLSLSTTHVRHGFWRFSGVLTRRGDPYRDQRVSAQVRLSGVWRDVKTKKTGRAGVVRFTARPKPGARRYPLRLYFDGTSEAQRAASKTFRIFP